MTQDDLTIAIVGNGGEGVVSAGEILVRATAHVGLYSMMTKNYGPQIRGGESLAQVRLAKSPVRSHGDLLDALLVLSWENFFRFSGEVGLNEDAVVFYDDADSLPDDLPFPDGVKYFKAPFADQAKKIAGTPLAKNIFALGFISGWFNLPTSGFEDAIRARFAKKSGDVLLGNLKAYSAGYEMADANASKSYRDWHTDEKEPKLILTGNDALSIGSLYGGVKFYAGYPITPASEIMEWMSRELVKFDGTFIQTEDEIAAITMAIGATFAGRKSMSATSGPGLSLMTEALGLASITELPLVIVDVQRSGPSTGIPTKTTQSDLFHAVYGGHGDMPRMVLAPMDVEDCIEIAIEAFYRSEKYQIPVIVLSDQFLGQRLEVIPQVDFEQFKSKIVYRKTPTEDELKNYKRYKETDDRVSPVSMPGMKGGMYTAAGLEHDEAGKPTSNIEIHEKSTQKRQHKLDILLEREDDLIWEHGDANPEVGILAWGSTKGAVHEVVDQLREQGVSVATLIPRQLMPLPAERIQKFIDQAENLLIIELSEGQFYTYLKSQVKLPAATRVLKRPGAAPFAIHEIINAIKEVNPKWSIVPQKTIEAI